MTITQKIIKYLALALAISIIVNIVYFASFALYEIGSIIGLTGNSNAELVKLNDTDKITFDDDMILEINLDRTNLTIKDSDSFYVESNNDDVVIKQKGNRIVFEDDDESFFSFKKKGSLVIYLPKDTTFKKVLIESSVGSIKIESLSTEIFSLDIGAGKVDIGYLSATSEADIDGGAGSVEISSGTINDLDLDVGVGAFTINAVLTGKNEIDSGVGELNVNLLDSLDNYRIKVEKGIGTIKLDGSELSNKEIVGTGSTVLNIEGGIGSINITTNALN